jgi:maltoporin
MKRIAKALALTAVVATAASARAADDRVSMFGYFRVQESWQLAPVKGAIGPGYYGLPGVPQKFRLGNENDWAEFGWNVLAYKGDDGTIGHAVIMLGGNYDPTNRGGGDLPFGSWESTGGTPVFKQLFVDLQKVPGTADATFWIGKKYYKRYYSGENDMFYWSDDGFGFGIEDINLGAAKLSYAAMDAGKGVGKQGIFHDLRLTDIAIMPGGHLDVGLGVATPIGESSDNLNAGVSGNIRWVQDVPGGNNALTVQFGTGPLGDSSQFGANQGSAVPMTASSSARKARIIDVLSFSPSKELGIDFVALFEHNEQNSATTNAGNVNAQYTNWLEAGGRLSYHFSPHASFLFDIGLDTTKNPGQDSKMLIKVTPALEIGTGYGNVPHIRFFVTAAEVNDATTGLVFASKPGEQDKTAFSFGIQGESWF